MEHRLRIGFGLVDLLDAYGATVEIGSAVRGAEGPGISRLLWNGYHSRLEAPAACEAIVHSLWVDWFEDRDTAETVFTEVLGKDITQLRPDAPEPLLRRARRVLESSGPVPWQASTGLPGRGPGPGPARGRVPGRPAQPPRRVRRPRTGGGARRPRPAGTPGGHGAPGRAAQRTGGWAV
ncbi:hypothetical protein [Streptomyces sp. NBC_00207]|uniref:hypothetical protein n=1 Tax=Streptomyces sp. NBC_00207 TaxID=2903635 RepID=UPI0032446F93